MRKLIAYFSASGVTESAAKELEALTGADLYEIRPEEPYTAADLDWRNRKSRSSLEMTDKASRPAIAKDIPDTACYDAVYIGFPIWWGVAPRIVNTFIEKTHLQGKTVVIFATSGGSGLDYAVKDLQKQYPDLRIKAGRLLKSPVTSDIM